MKDLIRLTDLQREGVFEIFRIADEITRGKYENILKDKSVILFFPNSSVRTRVTFEKGVYQLGGQSILFPSEALDKKEDLRDVCGYLNHWADMVIVRHKQMEVLEQISQYITVPVINAMTDCNHPCEILADMYALSKIRKDFTKDHYLFCGGSGNIGLSWKAASEILGFPLTQCCAKGYEMEGVEVSYQVKEAILGKDVVCTDSVPVSALEDFKDCQVTTEIMDMANKGAILNPCPPFYRGEEVSGDVIDSDYFVGYSFKKHLLTIQQAIMIYCMKKETNL